MVKAPEPDNTVDSDRKAKKLARLLKSEKRKCPKPYTPSEALARLLYPEGGPQPKKVPPKVDPNAKPWQETMRKYVFYGPGPDTTWRWEDLEMDPPRQAEAPPPAQAPPTRVLPRLEWPSLRPPIRLRVRDRSSDLEQQLRELDRL